MTLRIINNLDTDITRPLEQAIKNADGQGRCYARIDGKDKLTCVNKSGDEAKPNLWFIWIAKQVAEYYSCSFTIEKGEMTFFKPSAKGKRKNG